MDPFTMITFIWIPMEVYFWLVLSILRRNQSMQIRAIVVDEYNDLLQGEFILQVIDIFEDLDGDGGGS